MALKKKTETIEEIAEEVAEGFTSEHDIASVDKLNKVTEIVSDKFGLDNTYHVTKFNDKGNKVELTLENLEYIVAVTLKNPEIE
jgi:enoyl-[acyl-carrier-protein] reductase (NADH)